LKEETISKDFLGGDEAGKISGALGEETLQEKQRVSLQKIPNGISN
jgi:hypothetical protein